MNNELVQSFPSGIFTLITFFYWIFLVVWIFQAASDSSQKDGDTTGGAFMAALLIYAFVAYLLWEVTAYLADVNYAWANLIVIVGHMYLYFWRNEK